MAQEVDTARALKDKEYFNSLTSEQQEIVRSASPVGEAGLSDEDLEAVSGGLGGGRGVQATTTTTDGSCECKKTRMAAQGGPGDDTAGSCSCVC